MTDSPDPHCDGDQALADDLPGASVVTPTVQLLKGFADATRLRILCLLRGREVCVHEIVDALDMSHVYYRLADDHVRELLENALSHGAEEA
jgi:ArsR family transcriptional regulator